MVRSLLALFALGLFSHEAQAFTCADAQKAILNLASDTLESLTLKNQAYSDLGEFIQSKPSIDADEITTRSYLNSDGPFEQLWCKLKSQEAVAGALKAPSLGSVKSCASINASLLDAAVAKLYPDTQLSYQQLGIELLADQEFKTGAQWAPSALKVSKDAGKFRIQATRLHSATWVPVFGGMNYCKILSPAGAEALVQKAATESESERDAQELKTQKVEWKLGGIMGKQSALFYYQDSVEETLSQAKGIYIISPGGEIPAEAMNGLAKALHLRGFASFIVHYPKNLAILDTVSGRGNAALHLAKRLSRDPGSIMGLGLSTPLSLDIRIFGHSLGGATLADEVYKAAEERTVSHIALYGTAQFVKFMGSQELPAKPLALLFGQNDGLSRGALPGFLKGFGLAFDPNDFAVHSSPIQSSVVYQQIPELNHFCIVSDQNVGNAMVKRQDGKGLLPEQCLQRLVESLDQLGFL